MNLKKLKIFYKLYKRISNFTWKKIFLKFFLKCTIDGNYNECINFCYDFSPIKDWKMTNDEKIFNEEKYEAVKKWYLSGDRADKSILNYFDEYKRCIDDEHPLFNSNYGYYAYTQGGLKTAVDYLKKDKNTRQAMFCINNNEALSKDSIDKLCTNTIHFFIRNNVLNMYVNMRSSNMLTLLSYDASMFSMFYRDVKKEFQKVEDGRIYMTVASSHFYDENIDL